MPFNSKEGLSYIGDKVANMPVVGGMLKNPINTALLIALVILLINMFVFRNVETGESSLFILSLRASVYILGIAAGIIFLHQQHFLNELKKKDGSERLDEVFGGNDEITSLGDTELIPVEIGDPTASSS